jgi:hypothetical protein
MKMRRLILLGILVLSLVLITACDGGLPGNGGDGDSLVGDGKIMGTIENFNAEAGQILDVHVMLLEELDVNGEIELDDLIIAETTASSSDNYYTYEYSIDNIPEGEYYVAAFKDLNGNGSLDIGEGPIDAFGFYGLPELSEIPDELEGPPGNPEPVVIEGDETVTEIDFPAFSVALTTIEDFNGVVYNASGDPLEAEVEVELYGTAGIKLAEGIHNSTTGEYYFEDLLVPGEYYIKTSSAGLMPSITPLFYLLNDSVISDMPADLNLFLWSAFDLDVLPEDPISLMVVDNDGNCECLPDILMYTEGEAEYWGYESGNVFFTGQVTAAHGRILDGEQDL